MNRIAIFASGSGTNAEKIIRHFNHHPQIEVAMLMSNKPDAYALRDELRPIHKAYLATKANDMAFAHGTSLLHFDGGQVFYG